MSQELAYCALKRDRWSLHALGWLDPAQAEFVLKCSYLLVENSFCRKKLKFLVV